MFLDNFYRLDSCNKIERHTSRVDALPVDEKMVQSVSQTVLKLAKEARIPNWERFGVTRQYN